MTLDELIANQKRIDELRDRSKYDDAIIVGSEIRQLCDAADSAVELAKAMKRIREMLQKPLNELIECADELGENYGTDIPDSES